MEMQAAVLRDPEGPYALEPLDLAEPGPGEILVRIVGTGFCSTDTLPRDGDESGVRLPVITGHEGAGIVEAVGPGVPGEQHLVPGDHVALSFDSCGFCLACLGGHPAQCDTFAPRNLSGLRVDGSTAVHAPDGTPVSSRWFGQSSFATHCLATARNVVRVDPALRLELLGPLGCGIQTGAGAILVAMRVTAGSSVLVSGLGAMGLAAVMAARVAGATTIIAVDVQAERLDLARELGATHAIDAGEVVSDGDVSRQVQKITQGGADYGFDTTGVPDVIAGDLDALATGGTLGVVGLRRGEVRVGPELMRHMRTLRGIVEGDAVPQRFIPQLIELWQQGRFPFDRLIRTFPLSAINEAERAAASGEVVKPVLLPGG
ncbi:NAD(P)-dependent alcohol dehydrogenase [Streptomyces sp. 6N223]|uniref:NAD(P)-dependent alcohol dehydrogenase n=1 Tax=Streptomyces sp. 6N223 TaxID=3457412 RepID=UPI003FD6BEFC